MKNGPSVWKKLNSENAGAVSPRPPRSSSSTTPPTPILFFLCLAQSIPPNHAHGSISCGAAAPSIDFGHATRRSGRSIDGRGAQVDALFKRPRSNPGRHRAPTCTLHLPIRTEHQFDLKISSPAHLDSLIIRTEDRLTPKFPPQRTPTARSHAAPRGPPRHLHGALQKTQAAHVLPRRICGDLSPSNLWTWLHVQCHPARFARGAFRGGVPVGAGPDHRHLRHGLHLHRAPEPRRDVRHGRRPQQGVQPPVRRRLHPLAAHRLLLRGARQLLDLPAAPAEVRGCVDPPSGSVLVYWFWIDRLHPKPKSPKPTTATYPHTNQQPSTASSAAPSAA